jgi:AmmeMemoRadiSam system protein A
MEFSAANRQALIHLAADIIRFRLAGPLGGVPVPQFPGVQEPVYQQLAGCFTTLHDRFTHELRGCVGRLDASVPVWIAVRDSANSCLSDPRFAGRPVTTAEIPRLELELSVLSPLSPRGNPLEFDPAREGIYLTIAGRSGCFLPQVARETGWTREQLLDRLCTEKIGMPAGAWRMGAAMLSIFTAEILGPSPLATA